MADTNVSLVGLDSETVAAAVKPITKLMQHVARFVEPYHTRRQAEADAEAAIIRAKGEVQVARIKSEGEIELLERALARFAAVEMHHQRNLEGIVDSAKHYLPPTVTDTPVEDEWMDTFFDCAQNVSDANMRELWARVLAAEVASPGGYSKRSLRTLQDLAPVEARLFAQACGVSVRTQGMIFIPLLGNAPTRISFGECLVLDNCGLLHCTGTLTWIVNEAALLTLASGEQMNVAPMVAGQTVPCYPFTLNANELFRVVDASTPPGFAEEVSAMMQANGLVVTPS